MQYQESDLAFLSRMLEEEGIFYWFRHEAERHVLVLGDYSPALAALEGPDMLFAGHQNSVDAVRLHSWERSQELRPTNFVAWDQSFELMRQDQGFQNLQARKA